MRLCFIGNGQYNFVSPSLSSLSNSSPLPLPSHSTFFSHSPLPSASSTWAVPESTVLTEVKTRSYAPRGCPCSPWPFPTSNLIHLSGHLIPYFNWCKRSIYKNPFPLLEIAAKLAAKYDVGREVQVLASVLGQGRGLGCPCRANFPSFTGTDPGALNLLLLGPWMDWIRNWGAFPLARIPAFVEGWSHSLQVSPRLWNDKNFHLFGESHQLRFDTTPFFSLELGWWTFWFLDSSRSRLPRCPLSR